MHDLLEAVLGFIEQAFPGAKLEEAEDKSAYLEDTRSHRPSKDLEDFTRKAAAVLAKLAESSVGDATTAACELLWLMFDFMLCEVPKEELLGWPDSW